MNHFVVECVNDKIWNHAQLVRYLHSNRGQQITIGINPEATDLTVLGLYDLLDQFEFSHVTIVTNNPLEQHSKYQIKNRSFAWFLSDYHAMDPLLHTWNQSRVFMAMYGRPTAARLGIAAHLLQHHEEISHIHFSYGTSPDQLQMFELDKLLSYDIDSIEPAGKLIQRMPLTIADASTYVNTGYNFEQESTLTSRYADVLIDIVGETFVQGCTFLPTEKTTRPMLLKKPFVAFASANYLDYLHQLGFKTFCNYWDETYDGYQGRDRYLRILKLLDHLASMSVAQLVSMYESMRPVLEHNWELLRSQTYLRKVALIT
jgi:hypothetical protein